jgi:predicted O-methyltransferase YrrM
VSLLSTLLRPQDNAFEWGAGRSTRWLAARVERLTSIEHDSHWHSRVSARLGETRRVQCRLHRADPEGPADAGYCGAIEEFRDGSLDVVLIDGLFRDECARRALPKLAAGGLLVLDNSNWYMPSASHAPGSRVSGFATPLWQQLAGSLSSWRRIWTTSGVTDTTIWIRPGPR